MNAKKYERKNLTDKHSSSVATDGLCKAVRQRTVWSCLPVDNLPMMQTAKSSSHLRAIFFQRKWHSR
jgi:hypothetical protein